MRNRIAFKMYIPTKPSQYGLLFKSVNAARCPYTFACLPYCGKPDNIENAPYYIKTRSLTTSEKKGGGGDNLLYLLCLISNTMPQLEQSSLQPSTDLHHRHQQTFIIAINRPSSSPSQTSSSPSTDLHHRHLQPGGGGGGGLRSQKGLRPFNPPQNH